MAVDIKITYKLKGNDNWITLKITPEQYFDPLELDEEEYEVDSVPKFLDVRDYIKEKDNAIENVNIFSKDTNKNAEISYHIAYWNNGENFLVDRKDTINSELYHEIIVSLTTNPVVSEVLRFLEEDGVTRPIMHTRIFNHADGSQSEVNCLNS